MSSYSNRNRVARRAVAAVTALALAVACGRGTNAANDSAAAATPVDSAALAPPVGSEKPMMDSAFAAGQQTLDSLKAAGETPASGIAKGIQPAAAASANDSSAKAHKLHAKPTNVP